MWMAERGSADDWRTVGRRNEWVDEGDYEWIEANPFSTLGGLSDGDLRFND